jgi:YfiH family protein
VIKQSSDALFTEKKELALGIYHADCQAALFFDPIRKVIANVHCGWRGNVLNILGKTVQTLTDTFESDPKQLIVCISPSLGPDRSEFIHYLKELPASFYPFMYKQNYFDLWSISQSQLLKAGVEKNNIEIAKMCTFENTQMFHSYRRDKSAKRNLTFIAITSREQ